MCFALFLQQFHGCNCAAARCKHWVKHDADFVFDVCRQFAVVFLRLAGFFVAVHTDVSDLGGREQRMYAVYHTETGAQNGYDSDGVFGNYSLSCLFKRRFYHNFLGGYVLECLVGQQGGNFFHKLAEHLCIGVFVAENCNFVADKRVIDDCYVVHCSSMCLRVGVVDVPSNLTSA